MERPGRQGEGSAFSTRNLHFGAAPQGPVIPTLWDTGLGMTVPHRAEIFLLSLLSLTLLPLLERGGKLGSFSTECFLKFSMDTGLKGSRPTHTSTLGQWSRACMLSICKGNSKCSTVSPDRRVWFFQACNELTMSCHLNKRAFG